MQWEELSHGEVQGLVSLLLVCDGAESTVLCLLHDASLNLIYGPHRSLVIPVSI